jgi:hypothetical protein
MHHFNAGAPPFKKKNEDYIDFQSKCLSHGNYTQDIKILTHEKAFWHMSISAPATWTTSEPFLVSICSSVCPYDPSSETASLWCGIRACI